MSETTKAFTTYSSRIVRKLQNEVTVFSEGREATVRGLWDTGATNTCISQDVVTALNLVSTGRQTISTPSGESVVNTYLIDIALPNRVTIRNVQVCDSDIGRQGIGVLIGMDIITLGDFAVSNHDGKTVFTFRIPSTKVTDYYKQIVAEKTIGQRHGRGKRK